MKGVASMTETNQANEEPNWALPDGLEGVWRGIQGRRQRTSSRPPATGIDGVTAAIFDRDLSHNLAEISRILMRPSHEGAVTAYRFAPLLERTISARHNKERKVYTPRIRDQVVLRALHDVLTRTMEARRPESHPPSPRRCARQVIVKARCAGRLHVARIDVRDFYPSIDHDTLLSDLAALELGPIAHALLVQVLTETPHRPLFGDKSSDALRTKGVPTGISVASHLAHLFMAPIDEALSAHEGVTYIRFVDDILIAADSVGRLSHALEQVHGMLGERKLTVHRGKGVTTTFEEGFEFLGFVYEGARVLVTQPRIDKWLNRLRSIHRAHTLGGAMEAEGFVRALNAEISGHRGRHIPYYSLADNVEVYRQVDAQIRRMVGGVLRRSGMKPSVVTSAHDWARRYKRDYDAAKARAEARYGTSS